MAFTKTFKEVKQNDQKAKGYDFDKRMLQLQCRNRWCVGEHVLFIKEAMPMQEVSVADGYTSLHLSEVYNGRPQPTGWGRPHFHIHKNIPKEVNKMAKISRHEAILNRLKELAQHVADAPTSKVTNPDEVVMNAGWIRGTDLLNYIAYVESVYTE